MRALSVLLPAQTPYEDHQNVPCLSLVERHLNLLDCYCRGSGNTWSNQNVGRLRRTGQRPDLLSRYWRERTCGRVAAPGELEQFGVRKADRALYRAPLSSYCL